MSDQAQRAMDREEESLYRQLERGEITNEEYSRELRELQRDYREAAREAAENAYRDEAERW